jgi:hypothetical protein
VGGLPVKQSLNFVRFLCTQGFAKGVFICPDDCL